MVVFVNEIENFKRIELFKHYHEMDNPFIIMTIPLDITNVVRYAKEHGHFYATMGYVVGKAVNDVDELHYRYVNNKFYYYPKVSVNFTERVEGQIGFFDCDESELKNFIDEFDNKKAMLGQYNDSSEENRQDVIWVSCFPWAKFNSLVSPHDKNITIPQFIWDKYEKIGDNYYCNFMLMIHHGFADGAHVGLFIEKLNYYINGLK